MSDVGLDITTSAKLSGTTIPESGDIEMGVIRKKTATRGGEGGVKYVCDVCSADITSTVSSWPSAGAEHSLSVQLADALRFG